MCIYVDMCTRGHVLVEARGVGLPGAAIIDGCEPPDLHNGAQYWLLC